VLPCTRVCNRDHWIYAYCGVSRMIRDALLSQLVDKQAILFESGTIAQRENILLQIDARKDELRKEGKIE